MKSFRIKSTSSLAAITAAQLVAAAPAYAQAAKGAEESGIQEIIVTAQKRAENVQDVPIAVAAFGGQQLQERGVSDASQLANFTPSVQLSASSQIVSSPSSLSGFIRGIGQDDFSMQFEPGVGTYIDGVYLARTIGANANLLDVERVEILKGPQGTLFGRNTIGGAISVVTRQPGKEFGARLQAQFGRFNHFEIGGVIDVPLVPDRVLTSLAINYSERDGFQKRIPFPGAGNFVNEPISAFIPTGFVTGVGARSTLGGGSELNARLKVLINASESVRITLAGDYARSRQGGSATTLLRTGAADPTTLAATYNACINTPAAVLSVLNIPALPVNLGKLCLAPRVGPGTAIGGVNADAITSNDRLTYDNRFVTNDIDTTYGTGNNYSNLRAYGFTGTIDIDVADNVAVKSITAYRNQEWNIGLDLDGSPVVIFEPTILQKQHQFSQELQFSGKALDERLNWLVGAYYFDEHGDEQQNPIFAAGLFTVGNPASFDTRALAAFTHLNFKVTDQFSLTAGARYTDEVKHLNPSQLDVNLFLPTFAGVPPFIYPDPTNVRQLLPTARQRQKFTDFSPRLGIEFRPVADVMLYGSYSKGYKSGGWTTRVTAPQFTVPTFSEETADTFEIGLKSQLLDRHLQLNLAAFTTKYKDIQLLIQRGISPTFENAGTARINGVEAELQAVVSDAFRINASIGYVDAHFTKVDDPTGVIKLSSDLPRVPKWTAHIGPEYKIDFGGSGSVTLRGDYSYRSRVASDSENTPDLYGRAVSLVDASITYQTADERWSLTAGGRNIFNQRYIVNGTNQPLVGLATAQYNRPGEWYVSARAKF